ncbi:MAG: hypothetical protein ABEN55_12670 [Bradymonadaceae bacterium]
MSEAIIYAVAYGIALPALIGGSLWLLATEQRRWIGVLAVAVGFHVGYIVLNWKAGEVGASLLGFVGEPKETGYIVAVALVGGLLDEWGPNLGRRVASALFAGGVTGLMYLMVGDLFGDPWTVVGTVARIGIVAVGFGAMHWTLEEQNRRHPGATLPLVLTVIATGAAMILALRGTARIGQHVGILTAAVGASVPIAWWRPSFAPGDGGISAFLVVLAGLSTSGYFYMYGAPMYAALVWLAAPHTIWIAEIGPLDELSGWKQTVSRVMCVAAAVGVAIGIAWAGSSSF